MQSSTSYSLIEFDVHDLIYSLVCVTLIQTNDYLDELDSEDSAHALSVNAHQTFFKK